MTQKRDDTSRERKNARKRERYRTDPTYRQAQLDYQREHRRRVMEAGGAPAERLRERERASRRQRYAADTALRARRSEYFRLWFGRKVTIDPDWWAERVRRERERKRQRERAR